MSVNTYARKWFSYFCIHDDVILYYEVYKPVFNRAVGFRIKIIQLYYTYIGTPTYFITTCTPKNVLIFPIIYCLDDYLNFIYAGKKKYTLRIINMPVIFHNLYTYLVNAKTLIYTFEHF